MLMTNFNDDRDEVHIAISDIKFNSYLQVLFKYLRESKIPYYWNYKYNLKKSLSKANVSNVKFIIIIGEDEFKNNYFTIKNLNSGNQTLSKLKDINKNLNE